MLQVTQKLSDAELDATEQRQFEREYEQWCLEVELDRAQIKDYSEMRNLVNRNN